MPKQLISLAGALLLGALSACNSTHQGNFAQNSTGSAQNLCASRPQLLSTCYSANQAREIVLRQFPLGTTHEQIMQEFPLHFVTFELREDHYNGITMPGGRHDSRNVGTHSLLITIYKGFPRGFVPFIFYRTLHLGFDAEGKLLGVEITEEIDAP